MDFLISKISREKLNALVSEYGTDKLTLEIGSRGEPSYTKFFPNHVGVDVAGGAGVDVVASVYKLPFKNDSFDLALCLSVLEHLEEPLKAVSEIRRVVKNGGKIIVSVPFLFPIHDAPGDYWRFTKFGLQKMFSSGWQIEKLCAETSVQETFAVLLQRLGYQTKMRLNKFSKFFVFLFARLIEKMPNMIKVSFGDIRKSQKEPEAFTSAFFLVAKKI